MKVQTTLLTTSQVARYLRVDKLTIYRLLAQNKIPAFRVGNQWRFKQEMIDAWLMQNSNVGKNKFH
jgi:excisionase family DNA binding protein